MLIVSLKNVSKYERSLNVGWQEKGQEGIYLTMQLHYNPALQFHELYRKWERFKNIYNWLTNNTL